MSKPFTRTPASSAPPGAGAPPGFVPLTRPTPWRPEREGALLVGRLTGPFTKTARDGGNTDGETFTTYILRTGTGVGYYLSGVSLVSQIETAALRPGEDIAVRFLGMRDSELGNGKYRAFDVYVRLRHTDPHGMTQTGCDEGDEPPV